MIVLTCSDDLFTLFDYISVPIRICMSFYYGVVFVNSLVFTRAGKLRPLLLVVLKSYKFIWCKDRIIEHKNEYLRFIVLYSSYILICLKRRFSFTMMIWSSLWYFHWMSVFLLDVSLFGWSISSIAVMQFSRDKL